jgi:hypothetical protein
MSVSIQNLPQNTPVLGDLLPFFSSSAGRDSSCSITTLAGLILAGLSSAGFVTQYSSPNTSPYTVTVAPPTQGESMWLALTPTGTIASLTVNLPIGSDGQEVLVSTTQALTSLTVTGATVGASPQPVNGAPTTMAANAFFRLRFDGVSSSWYRVG